MRITVLADSYPAADLYMRSKGYKKWHYINDYNDAVKLKRKVNVVLVPGYLAHKDIVRIVAHLDYLKADVISLQTVH